MFPLPLDFEMDNAHQQPQGEGVPWILAADAILRIKSNDNKITTRSGGLWLCPLHFKLLVIDHTILNCFS